MSPPVPTASDVPEAALRELDAAYAELDRQLAASGMACRACGACCDFARHAYRLYATRLERARILASHPPPQLTPDGLCGYLRDGRCSIHRDRPLGCRTFFCDAAQAARQQALHHACLRRLRAIAQRHGVPWGYAPLFPQES